MKNINSKNRIDKKLNITIIISVFITLLLSAVFTIIFAGTKKQDSKPFADVIDYSGYIKDIPKNFSPSITLNKYQGANCSFDEDNERILLELPKSYDSQTISVTANAWTTNGNVYVLNTNNVSYAPLSSISLEMDKRGILTLEVSGTEMSNVDTFEMRAPDELIDYVHDNAAYSKTAYSNKLENTIAFYDAQINTISENGEEDIEYNHADECWYNFTQSQVDELKKYLNDRSKKTKFKALSNIVTNKHLHYFESNNHKIEEFIPLSALYVPGKSAFIGQEYGYVLKTHDSKRISYGDGKYWRETYDHNRIKLVEYKFDPNDCDLQIDYFLVFAIDRELKGREYHIETSPILRADSGFFQCNDQYGITYHINTDWSHIVMTDPVMSVSLKNSYDYNEYDSEYSPEEACKNDIGVSQVRINFQGYNGKGEQAGANGDDIAALILSMAKDVKSVTDTGLSIKKKNDKDFAKKYNDTVKNIFGDAVDDMLDLAASVNPYIGIAKTVINAVKNIYEFIDNFKTTFKKVSANNENNILTFPAPSQSIVKRAIAMFGNIKELDTSDSDLSKKIYFEDGSPAKFAMSDFGDYMESIFMLSETDKPTTLMSFVNPSFGFMYEGLFVSTNIEKLNIPDRYNYSSKTMKIFDTEPNELVKEDEGKRVLYFGSDERDIQLAISKSGNYDISIENLTAATRIRLSNCGISEFEDDQISVYNINENISNNISLYINGSPIRSNNNGLYSTYLNANDTNILTFKATPQRNLSVKNHNTRSGYLELESLGASFDILLSPHYDMLDEVGTATNINDNDSVTYAYKIESTKAKRIELDGPTSSTFDIYSSNFIDIIKDQKVSDMLFYGNETYYITIHNNSNRNAQHKISFTEIDSSVESFQANVDLTESSSSCVMPLKINRAGTYTVDCTEGINLHLKNEQGADYLFGSSKTFLNPGQYYITLKSATYKSCNISVNFTPRDIMLESPVKQLKTNYYTFNSKLAGFYTFDLNINGSVTVDGLSPVGKNKFEMVANSKYIVTVSVPDDSSYTVTVKYTPQITNINKEFTNNIVELNVPITGIYGFKGGNVTLYDEKLNVIRSGNINNQLLFANQKYFVANNSAQLIAAVLMCDVLTVNNEITVGKTDGTYYKFVAPETGYYTTYSRSGNALFKIYDYGEIAFAKDTDEDDVQNGNAYRLIEDTIYYFRIKTSGNDIISITNADIKALPVISANQLKVIQLEGVNDSKSYKFIVDKDAANKNGVLVNNIVYNVLIEHALYQNITLMVDKTSYAIPADTRVSVLPITFKKGIEHEIIIQLDSECSAEITFGIMTQIPNYSVYVSNRLLNESCTVNKISVQNNVGTVTEKISIVNTNGLIPTFTIINAPKINGQDAVEVSPDGVVTVNNALPQWTAFSVLVNIGRIENAGIVLEDGEFYVVDFLVYVDIEDIAIFDKNDNPVYSLDIEPKETIDLTAKVFPAHAAEADKLSYQIIEGEEFIDFKVNANNVVSITAKYTAPNNSYVKIAASCGNEFKVYVLLRIHCDQIYINSKNDVAKLTSAVGTAYEVIVNSSYLYGYSDTKTLLIPSQIKYLKIKSGSCKSVNVSIKAQSDNLTLVLESITIRGTKDGAINADGHNLHLHLIDKVVIIGLSGGYATTPVTGYSAIVANNLLLTNETLDVVSQIYGGDGGASDTNGGNGGIAIVVQDTITIQNASKITITGGYGGQGSVGKNGSSAINASTDQTGENGEDGEIGKPGGNGGVAISCNTLKIQNSLNITITGGNGGDGGKGGDGGSGGNGGNGHPSNWSDASDGKPGGNGGNGGVGGNGGNGAIAMNKTNCVITDSTVAIGPGSGGNAGYGGNAGNGGCGGNGGNDETVIGQEGAGGRGGNGGNGGHPGSAGIKGDNISVSSTNSKVSTVAASNGQAGEIGYKGYGGEGGNRGTTGGYDADVSSKAAPGSDGEGRDKS